MAENPVAEGIGYVGNNLDAFISVGPKIIEYMFAKAVKEAIRTGKDISKYGPVGAGVKRILEINDALPEAIQDLDKFLDNPLGF